MLALRGSYLCSIVIALEIAKAGRQVPKPRCLSPAANSLSSRIAGGQVPEPRPHLPRPQNNNLPKNIVWGPRAGFIFLNLFDVVFGAMFELWFTPELHFRTLLAPSGDHLEYQGLPWAALCTPFGLL